MESSSSPPSLHLLASLEIVGGQGEEVVPFLQEHLGERYEVRESARSWMCASLVFGRDEPTQFPAKLLTVLMQLYTHSQQLLVYQMALVDREGHSWEIRAAGLARQWTDRQQWGAGLARQWTDRQQWGVAVLDYDQGKLARDVEGRFFSAWLGNQWTAQIPDWAESVEAQLERQQQPPKKLRLRPANMEVMGMDEDDPFPESTQFNKRAKPDYRNVPPPKPHPILLAGIYRCGGDNVTVLDLDAARAAVHRELVKRNLADAVQLEINVRNPDEVHVLVSERDAGLFRQVGQALQAGLAGHEHHVVVWAYWRHGGGRELVPKPDEAWDGAARGRGHGQRRQLRRRAHCAGRDLAQGGRAVRSRGGSGRRGHVADQERFCGADPGRATWARMARHRHDP